MCEDKELHEKAKKFVKRIDNFFGDLLKEDKEATAIAVKSILLILMEEHIKNLAFTFIK